MHKLYVVRDSRGRYWQTSRGFIGTTPAEATKYPTRQDAEGVCGLCCRPRDIPRVEEYQP